LTPPDDDVFEVSVFSRGYGEAIAIHVGHGRWLLIDSLKNSSGDPAAIAYLDNIGVDTRQAVEAVLITHWHDDHVAGASVVVARCEAAEIVLSGALQRDEFRAFLARSTTDNAGSFGSGVEELLTILRQLKAEGRRPKWAWADMTLAASRGDHPYRFEALSPSTKDFEELLENIHTWAQPSGRLRAPKRNDASVAAVVTVAEDLALFGADLEIRGLEAGWAAVHSKVWKDRAAASLYKIAHHGSVTGCYEPVWADMIVRDAIAVLTPWSRGSKLPSPADIDRILNYTPNAHAASKVRSPNTKRRSNTVERSLREANIKLLQESVDMGQVRFRKRAGEVWNVEYLSGGSCHLKEVLAA